MSKSPSQSFESLLADIGFDALASNRLQIRRNGSVIEINSNSKHLLKRLAEKYPTAEQSTLTSDFFMTVLDEEESGLTQVLDEKFIELSCERTLQKLSSGMVFLKGKKSNLVKGPASANIDEVVAFIDKLLQDRTS